MAVHCINWFSFNSCNKVMRFRPQWLHSWLQIWWEYTHQDFSFQFSLYLLELIINHSLRPLNSFCWSSVSGGLAFDLFPIFASFSSVISSPHFYCWLNSSFLIWLCYMHWILCCLFFHSKLQSWEQVTLGNFEVYELQCFHEIYDIFLINFSFQSYD